MPGKTKPWFFIDNIDEIDSPALVVYPDRVIENIQLAIKMIGDVNRLRPHVKTHKSADVTKLMLDAGITKFKCATIAEAEMVAAAGAADVLLAYQLTGPKVERWMQLQLRYPSISFASLVDNVAAARLLNEIAVSFQLRASVFIDLNTGMNRTGIAPGPGAMELIDAISVLKNINLVGLHVYDGHISNTDFPLRVQMANKGFMEAAQLKEELTSKDYTELKMIAGGSPTFPVHAKRKDIECSPGTFVYWDASYLETLPEQKFQPAALVISRIISLPAEHLICTDLGHKSVAAENPVSKRVKFINRPDLDCISQSEEHLVAHFTDGRPVIGDVLYGLPVHICPTVALYERAFIVEDHHVTGEWKITARDRRIKI
jgi:D-serine deaminase-like pyridoxal phosphate-dependent protein